MSIARAELLYAALVAIVSLLSPLDARAQISLPHPTSTPALHLQLVQPQPTPYIQYPMKRLDAHRYIYAAKFMPFPNWTRALSVEIRYSFRVRGTQFQR